MVTYSREMIRNLIFFFVSSAALASSISALSVGSDGTKNGKCVLPPYPANGAYVANHADAKPGDSFDFVALNITCSHGYEPDTPYAFCSNGWWPEKIPQCISNSRCHLSPDPSVEYLCVVSGDVEGTRACNELEPEGTVVRPVCQTPNYFSDSPLLPMRCIKSTWDYIATCKPECGTVTPQGSTLIFGGTAAKRGEVPWHAGIFIKTTKPYRQICGGSLISNTIVISAAHCFWDQATTAQFPTVNYAVAVGKLYRPWSDTKDDAQKSDVKEVHIPQGYRGSEAYFQNDIAVVVVESAFAFRPYIRPVCVRFGSDLERALLKPGNMGKIAGWGMTSEDGQASPVLKVVDLPYIDANTCIAKSSPAFRPFIAASDKFCAGYTDGQAAICQGDAGGGLAFPHGTHQRYYLAGVVSVAERSEHICNVHAYTGFTNVLKHELLITDVWK